jgi:hypothetical protein
LIEAKELRGGVAERKDDSQRDAFARDGRTARKKFLAPRALKEADAEKRIAVNPKNRDAACT